MNLRITKIALIRVGVFRTLTLSFPEKTEKNKAEIHIFTGENGSGKSTLLYALSIVENDNLVSKRYGIGIGGGLISITFSNNENICNYAEYDEARAQLKKNTFFTGYGDFWVENYLRRQGIDREYDFAFFAYSGSRAIHSSPTDIKGNIANHPLENALDFEKSIDSALLSQWIANTITKAELSKEKAKAKKYRQTLSQVENMIAEIMEKHFSFHLDTDTLQLQVKMEEKYLEFDVLPDGLKSMISWLGDLLMRLDRINWAKDEEGKDIPILKRNFILFLDEIEIHLHPAWQRRILPVIQKLFPNAQIFISTHSPFVVNSVDGAYIYELKNENGVTSIASPTISATNQSIDYVLSKVFGVSEKYGEETEKQLADFYELRDKVLNKETIDTKKFLNQARHLAEQNLQIQSKIQYELLQLRKITGKEAYTI